MTSPSQESLDVLSRALDQAHSVLADVREEQLSLPTPCSDWEVSRVISHLIDDAARFRQAVTGGDPDWSTQPQPVSGDWAATFRAEADQLMDAWRQTDDAESDPDWQTPEIAVHTWDLVRATGQDRTLDPEVAERGLAFMSKGLTPENRGSAFAAEVEIGAEAPVYDRLAAFAGRDPA